jgi:hypothetical protein
VNYRIAYNFLTIELNTTNKEETEQKLKDKGFTDLKFAPKKNDPAPEPNKLWIAYRYNFIVPVTGVEPPLIRVDKWYQDSAFKRTVIEDFGLINWFSIYVVTATALDLDRIERVYNTPINAGSVGLTNLIWTLFTDNKLHKHYLLINNKAISLHADIGDLKKFTALFDLIDSSVVEEVGRKIEVL